MQIHLNGKTQILEPQITISTLLSNLKLSGKPVVVELNQLAILPRNYSETILKQDDKLEIVTLAAGG